MLRSLTIPILPYQQNQQLLTYGALFAMRMGLPLQLLKIATPSMVMIPAMNHSPLLPAQGTIMAELEEEKMMMQAKEDLHAHVEHIRRLTDHHLIVNPVLTRGEPFSEILNFAGKDNEKLLILEQEEEVGTWELITGTLTTRMMEELDVPMLVVPQGMPFRRIEEITYITEGIGQLLSALAVLTALDPYCRPHIHIVLTYTGVTDMLGNRENVEKLLKLITRESGYPHLSVELRGENNLMGLSKRKVEKRDSDMLVLHHRDRSLLEKIFISDPARKWIFRSEIPLMIFPDA